MEPEHKDIGTMAGTMVAERRKRTRYHLVTRVDVLVAGDGQVCWGSLRNLSWAGVAICAMQVLKPGQRVTLRFRFQGEEGLEVTESLVAKVIWRSGDNMGLEFEPSLTTGSPALKQAAYLVAHLMMKEA